MSRAPAFMVAILGLVLTAGCVVQPTGPSVAVMPGPNKPFEVFAQDEAVCRQYAAQLTAGGAAQASGQEVGAAVVGTALGAAVGAAAGGGKGAAIGAASGAVVGTAAGAGPAARSQYEL